MNYQFTQQQTIAQRDIYAPMFLDNVLSNEEILELNNIGEKLSPHPASVGNGAQGVVNENVRRTLVSWIEPSVAPTWFHQRILELFKFANEQSYKFELSGAEPAQYTKYEANFQGEYKWHADIMQFENVVRKLSVSILLNDPSEYDGGNLILSPHGQPITLGDRKGRAIFFPSWVPHCVTPITRGVRKSLVIWAHGPAFK